MKRFKTHSLIGILFLGLLMATLSSCKTCNCPAYSLQQIPAAEPSMVRSLPTG